jgi:hypothetical protein
VEGGPGLLLAAYSVALVWGKFTLVSTQQPIVGAITVRRILEDPPTPYPDTVGWIWWVVTFIIRNSFLCELFPVLLLICLRILYLVLVACNSGISELYSRE